MEKRYFCEKCNEETFVKPKKNNKRKTKHHLAFRQNILKKKIKPNLQNVDKKYLDILTPVNFLMCEDCHFAFHRQHKALKCDEELVLNGNNPCNNCEDALFCFHNYVKRAVKREIETGKITEFVEDENGKTRLPKEKELFETYVYLIQEVCAEIYLEFKLKGIHKKKFHDAEIRNLLEGLLKTRKALAKNNAKQGN